MSQGAFAKGEKHAWTARHASTARDYETRLVFLVAAGMPSSSATLSASLCLPLFRASLGPVAALSPFGRPPSGRA